MVIEISVAVIAVAFLALVIYLILLTVQIRETLAEANQTLQIVKKHLTDSDGEIKQVLVNTHLISSNLLNKMRSLDSIFQTVSNVGDFIEQKTEPLREEAIDLAYSKGKYSYFNQKVLPQLSKVSDAVGLILMSMKLWKKFNNGR
ncbi:MAG: DUF948 domain-containing protein [Leadbetterella sp.]|nr:DUF948 domain-containing protein [Leadbetterella sp.]